jgi:hypothetical protein
VLDACLTGVFVYKFPISKVHVALHRMVHPINSLAEIFLFSLLLPIQLVLLDDVLRVEIVDEAAYVNCVLEGVARAHCQCFFVFSSLSGVSYKIIWRESL